MSTKVFYVIFSKNPTKSIDIRAKMLYNVSKRYFNNLKHLSWFQNCRVIRKGEFKMDAKIATLIILAVYVAIMVGIGIYTSKRTKSSDDFMLGGRSVGSWLTAFSYGTTYFSAVVFIGYAGQFGWMYGASAAWVGIGNAIIGSLIPFFLIGKRTRLMTNHIGARTMPEYFEHRFVQRLLKQSQPQSFSSSLSPIQLQFTTDFHVFSAWFSILAKTEQPT